jgi:hypothetical protein
MAKQGTSKELKKATDKYHEALLKYQQLQKKFVAEPNPAKREPMKAALIAAHKEAKAAEKEFNHVVASEPVDYDALTELKKSIKEAIRIVLKEI